MINFSFDCLLDMSYTHHYLGNLKHRYLFCISGSPFFKMRNLAIKMSAQLGCLQIERCDTRTTLHRHDLLKRLSKPYFPFENCHATFWTKCGEKLNCGCRSIR